MKKTFTINISGNVFYIEEEAFEKLQNYLQSLNVYFSTQEGGQEIIQDIESRIAELFREMITEKQEIVSLDQVDTLMAKMGKPEDFMETDDTQSDGNNDLKDQKVRKRMYRDTENRVLGGVCSGMSAYFNIDPVFFRILFILLVFLGAGISIVLYLIFWVVVPKAVTTSQRLEMRGEVPTISNIQKTIQEEIKEVKNSFSRYNHTETLQKGRNVINRIGQGFTRLLKGTGRVLTILLGGLLIFIGFASFLLFFISLTLGNSIFEGGNWSSQPNIDLSSFLGFFISPGLVSISILLIVILVGIPLLVIFFIGTRMIFRFKTNNKAIGLGAFGIWLLAFISGVVITVTQANNYAQVSTVSTGQQIDCKSCKTLYLELGKSPEAIENDENIHFNEFIITYINGKQALAAQPHLNIESNDGNDFIVSVKRKARGKNREEIQQHLQNIQYDIYSKDSTLVLSPFFTVVNESKWCNQEVLITVKVPKGKKIHLGPEIEQLQLYFENISNEWEKEIIGQSTRKSNNELAMNR